DIVGVAPPENVNGIAQMPIHGVSLAYTFPVQAKAEPSRKGAQYFEMFGHRGIWADGWKAVTFHPAGKPFDEDRWELYNLANDFSECRDLAKD
ncbi:arylsulfatase, partial [Serratia marcescens]|nr:arylsulfatase [Serratia marcescens]